MKLSGLSGLTLDLAGAGARLSAATAALNRPVAK